MKSVAVITSTRADFGLLLPLIKELRKFESKDFYIDLIVTGTHLSDLYGHTIDEIRAQKIRIDEIVEIPVLNDSALDISTNQSNALVKFTEIFDLKKYNAIVILGDRYEIFSVAIAAGNLNIPIIHLCGGDTTEGAIDEWIRHSISKMSYLHFPTNIQSYNRIVQMGEDPKRVFNYGSTSIDNIYNIEYTNRLDALKSIGLADCKYAICTYHPVTMEPGGAERDINALLGAIKLFPNIMFIFTKSNADQGGEEINHLLDDAKKQIKNFKVYSSLGINRYLNLMKHAEFVLGNSSSGIIETPSFSIPTINIGDRQRGRLQSESTINCDTEISSISKAIEKALSYDFKEKCKGVASPYGDGHAAENIAKKIYDTIMLGRINLKKRFFDLEVKP